MTKDKHASGAPEKTPPSPETGDSTAPGNPANKAFWLGMGVGSAALVAALMYASKRPGRRS